MAHADIDPTTFEVVRHRTWQITDEAGIALKHVSVSPVVTEVNDFSTGIFLPDGSPVQMGAFIQAHFGSAPAMVRSIIADCSKDPGINEGDMFITNDPWKGALHTADVAVIAPLHWKGHLVGFTQATAHQLDIGMIVAGGFAVTQEIYQEGVRMPPTKIVVNGEIRNDVIKMIANMIRHPQVVLDFKGLIAANNVARIRIYELFERYGASTVLAIWEDMIARSRAMFKARLREFPDGTFSHVDRIEFDGLQKGNYEFRLQMVKKGGDLTFDFTGTSPQAEHSINCTMSGTIAGIAGGLQPSLCPDIPWNEGILGSFKVIAPPGTLCNAVVPAPVCRSSVTAAWIVRNCTQACVGKMMATSLRYAKEAMAVWTGNQNILEISGINQYGDRFAHVFLDTMAGGGGASASHDGIDCAGDAYVVTLVIANVESHEATNPVLFLYRRRLADSGGAGKFRGGLSVEDAITPYGVDRIQATSLSNGFEVPNAAGLFGGYPGCQSASALKRKTNLAEMIADGILPRSMSELQGTEEELEICTPFFTLEKGDVFSWYWSGGGGYGDPLDRDPSLVKTDFAGGAVTREEARSLYGVVFTKDPADVDSKRTQDLRAAIRKSRLG